MLFGLIAFMWGKPLLQGAGEPPNPAALTAKKFAGLSTEWLIYLATFVGVGVVWFLIQDQGAVKWVLYIAFAIVYGWIILTSVLNLPPHPRNRIFAALILICILFYWGHYLQRFGSG